MVVYNEARKQKGQKIAERIPDQIKRINKTKFLVKSQTNSNDGYIVHLSKSEWGCTCNDYSYKQKKCKHIYALEFRGLIKHVEMKQPTWIIPEIDKTSCPYCGSDKFRKYGWRYNKRRKEQKYDCMECHRKYCDNVGFKNRKYKPQVITYAMHLYFSGLSFRGVAKSLNLIGLDITHHSVSRWVTYYTQMIQAHLNATIVPQVGTIWRADEIFLKIKGRQRYLFMSMDDKTRFWISKELADTKFHHDARKLLSNAKEITQSTPSVFITDGSPVYDRAFRKEFRVYGDELPIHINTIRLDGNHNNNMMERLNGEFRDKEKTTRGVKKKDSVVISGYQLYHNYFRPHTSLGGKTPAEVAGIRILGEDKWKTLIQNAQRKITPKQYSITEFFGNEIKIPVNTDEDGKMNLESC